MVENSICQAPYQIFRIRLCKCDVVELISELLYLEIDFM